MYCGLAMTGGSFAKTPANMPRNSTMVALYFEVSANCVLPTTAVCSHPKHLSNVPGSDDTLCLLLQHAAQASRPCLLSGSRRPSELRADRLEAAILLLGIDRCLCGTGLV